MVLLQSPDRACNLLLLPLPPPLLHSSRPRCCLLPALSLQALHSLCHQNHAIPCSGHRRAL